MQACMHACMHAHTRTHTHTHLFYGSLTGSYTLPVSCIKHNKNLQVYFSLLTSCTHTEEGWNVAGESWLSEPSPSEWACFCNHIHVSHTCKHVHQPQCLIPFNSQHQWAFLVTALCIWNSLPSYIRSCRNVHRFKWHLKTQFFSESLNMTPLLPLCLSVCRSVCPSVHPTVHLAYIIKMTHQWAACIMCKHIF